MTIDANTMNFLSKLNADRAMQEALNKAVKDASNPLEGAVAFAASKGFQISAESLGEAKRVIESSAEMSDAQLDSVAGGFNPQPEPPGDSSYGDSSLIYQFDANLLSW